MESKFRQRNSHAKPHSRIPNTASNMTIDVTIYKINGYIRNAIMRYGLFMRTSVDLMSKKIESDMTAGR